MFCEKCGREIEDNSNFCQYCGANFVNVTEGKNNFQEKQSVIRKKLNKKVLIGSLAVCLILLIGCGIVYMKGNQSGDSSELSEDVPNNHLEAERGTFYRCSPTIPFQIDDAIWGMTESEFEEYTGIPLVYAIGESAGSEFLTGYDIHFLHTDIETMYLEGSESFAFFSNNYGLMLLWYEAHIDDWSGTVNAIEEYQEAAQKELLGKRYEVDGCEMYPGQTEGTISMVYGDESYIEVIYYSKDWILSNSEEIVQQITGPERYNLLLDIANGTLDE